MNKMFNLVKKELDKIFKNPRTVITNFILPGLLIFLVYTILGNIMSATQSDMVNASYKIAVVNNSSAFTAQFNNYNKILESSGKNKLKFTFEEVDINVEDFTRIIGYKNLENPTEEETKVYNFITNSINNADYDAWICFNKNFDEKYLLNNQLDKAVVGVFGKNTIDKSSYALTMINTILNSMQPKVISNLLVDFSTQTDVSTTILASMIPMFLIVFVFSGGMSVCADSIAGEKERGTLSTLLMTPIKRSHIIYGKIISLVITTIVSAIGPFIAVIVSIPQLLKGSGLNLSVGLELSATSIFQIFLLVIVTALLSTSIYLLFSTIAKSVKEASMFSGPVSMIAIILAALATSLNLGNSIGLYFVPFMNIALGINGAITGILTVEEIVTIVFSTLLYCIILIVISIKLFNSEKVLFSK